MSSLPEDRVTVDPPFTHVGLDVFGPWGVTFRRTRGNSVESKRWAVMFTCLSTRAVHLEVIEAMSSSSFVNCVDSCRLEGLSSTSGRTGVQISLEPARS